MSTIKIAPSLLCMNLLEVGRQVSVLNKVADTYHCDLIDNHFTPWFGLPIEFLLALKSVSSLPMDIHMMVNDVEETTEVLLHIRPDVITLPIERIACCAFRLIARIREAGARVGVSLNPVTPVESLKHILPIVDKVTVLTVDPGRAGQVFVGAALAKVTELAAMRNANGLNYDIEMDGSCNQKNYHFMLNAGANQFVVGKSGLFSLDQDIDIAWQKMKKYMHD